MLLCHDSYMIAVLGVRWWYVVTRQLPVHPELGLGQPSPELDYKVYNCKDDDRYDQNANDKGSRDAAAVLLHVQEWVDVEAIQRVTEVGEPQVQREEDDHGYDMDPVRRFCSWYKDLEESEERVEGVFGDVVPGAKRAVQSTVGQQAPEDTSDQERESSDSGIVPAVRPPQRTSEAADLFSCAGLCIIYDAVARKASTSSSRVDEPMDSGNGKVETQSVPGQDGEEGEGDSRGVCITTADLKSDGRKNRCENVD